MNHRRRYGWAQSAISLSLSPIVLGTDEAAEAATTIAFARPRWCCKFSCRLNPGDTPVQPSPPLCGSEEWRCMHGTRGDGRRVRTQCKRGCLPRKHGSVATDGSSESECRCDPASPDHGVLTSSASAFQRCRGASRRIHWGARPWQHSTKRRMTQICPSRSRERHHPWERRRRRRKHRQERGRHASKRKAFLFFYDPREAPCVLCPRPLSEFCYSGKKNRTRIFWFRFERISICLYHSLVKILLQTIIASNETIRYHYFKSRF